jgi:hypothetical protein
MAERDVTVRIATIPGTDSITPALQKQQQAAAAVGQQLQANQRALAAPVQQVAGAAPQLIPPGQITALQPRGALPDGGELSGRIGGQVRGIITNQLLQASQSAGGGGLPPNRLAEVAGVAAAFSSLPGPIGQVASAFSVVASVGGALAATFTHMRVSAAELVGEQQRAADITRRVRGQGAPEAADIRQALGPIVAGHVESLQRQGRGAEAVQTVRREGERAQTRLEQLEALNPGEIRARLESQLMAGLADYRTRTTPWTRQAAASRAIAQGRPDAARLRAAGIAIPAELENIDFSTLTPERIQQLVGSITTGPLEQMRAAATVGRAVGREGQLANLRPGAVQLSELQTLTPARQGDVLDIHSQIQAETFRDQREEARFQQQFSLWQQFFQEQRATNQIALGQGGNNPVVAALQGLVNQIGGLFGGGAPGAPAAPNPFANLPGWFQTLFGPG